MWVDYRGSLSTVYNDGEISTRGHNLIEVHSVQSTMMGRSQHVGIILLMFPHYSPIEIYIVDIVLISNLQLYWPWRRSGVP